MHVLLLQWFYILSKAAFVVKYTVVVKYTGKTYLFHYL